MSIKLVGKNTIIYAIGNVGMRGASFLIIPLYTHLLSMSDYGTLMVLLLTIQFMMIAMNGGMRQGLVRFGKTHEKENRLSELLGTSCLINILGGLAVTLASITLLCPFFSKVLHSDNINLYIGLACGVSLLQSLSLHMMAYYRTQNNAIKFMIAGFLSAVILFIVSYIFLYVFDSGIRGALLAKIITNLIVLFLMSVDIFRKHSIRISFSVASELIRYSFPLLFSTTGELIITGASMYFLSLFYGLEAVAVYSLGDKLAAVLAMLLILPFQFSFEPYVFASLETPDIRKKMSKLLTYLILAVPGMCFCILFGSRLFLRFFAPPEYSSAFTVIVLLLPAVAFMGIYYFAQTLLGAAKKTHIVGLAMTAGVLLCIPLNYILIKKLNWYGAVIALNISNITIGSALLIVGLKKFAIPIEWKRICIAFGLLVFILFVFFAVRNTSLLLFSMITLTVATGSVLALFSSRFFNRHEILVIKKLALRYNS